MKNRQQELLIRLMRQYHRHGRHRLQGRLYIPHVYDGTNKLSWWGDVGFILNGREVMVYWIHPRMKYRNAIQVLAWHEAGEPPLDTLDLFEVDETHWKKLGLSRKKIVSHTTKPTPEFQRKYYDSLDAIEKRLQTEGIEHSVYASLSIKRGSHCLGVDICIPIEVITEDDVESLAALVKRVLKGETSIALEFPSYLYSRQDWVQEAALRDADRVNAGSTERIRNVKMSKDLAKKLDQLEFELDPQ